MSDYEIIKNKSDVTHNTSVRRRKIEWIVIHYTATDGATGANEITYFSRKTTKNASSDFFVNFDGTIYQYNNEVDKRYCWAVGGRKLSTGGGSMHGIVKNSNSVSIEMCTKQVGNTWVITNETYNATIWLARVLRYLFGIGKGHTVRHYDVTGKLCPYVTGFINNPDSATWEKMCNAIDADEEQKQTSTAREPFSLNVNYRVTAKRGLKVHSAHDVNSRTLKVYKYGTVFTCKDIYHGTDGRYWIKTPSGWICAIDKDGSHYAG